MSSEKGPGEGDALLTTLHKAVVAAGKHLIVIRSVTPSRFACSARRSSGGTIVGAESIVLAKASGIAITNVVSDGVRSPSMKEPLTVPIVTSAAMEPLKISTSCASTLPAAR